jgi:predicted MFS family arabinose efflux permease
MSAPNVVALAQRTAQRKPLIREIVPENGSAGAKDGRPAASVSSIAPVAPIAPAIVVADPVAPASRWRLSRSAAFYLQASITISFLAGSIAPTPLYPLYQAQWGFSPITVTVVFGIYALAVLSALLVTGRLSDHIGRRPVLLAAILAQIATMLIFATAGGLTALLVARVLQGLSTGAAVAAVGAGLLDLDKARGTTANAIAPPLGTAVGGLLAGFVIQFLPAPAHLVYLILGAVFIAQAIGVLLMHESISPQAGALRSLRPQIGVPAVARTPLLLAIPALMASWALIGLFGALDAALVRNILGFGSSLIGGLSLFVLAASGALSTFLMRARPPRTMTSFGSAGLLVGMAVIVAASLYHDITTFFVGITVAGLGFGAAFQGAIRSIVPLAAAHERAGVLSVIFVVSYLAMGVPAVIAGFMLALEGNIFETTWQFGAAEMVLAALALFGAVMRRPAK